MTVSITIREFRPSDSIEEITQLLHRAYAVHTKQGLDFLAATQDENTTFQRLSNGFSFLAMNSSKIIGTITVYGPEQNAALPLYRQKNVYHFGQFAVDPSYQGQSIGKRLLVAVEEYCKRKNATTLALDTSEKAEQLISLYRNWGFNIVDITQWGNTNYNSVILAKNL